MSSDDAFGLMAQLSGDPIQNNSVSEGASPNEIDVNLIDRHKYQPRKTIDDETLNELVASIQAQGVIQPIVIRPMPEGRYELVAGQRRLLASKKAGLSTIPAVVRHDIDDEKAIEIALTENIQKEQMKPLEEARSIEELINISSLKHFQVAKKIGKSKDYVSRMLAMLKMPDILLAAVESGKTESPRTIGDLNQLYEKSPDIVAEYLADNDEIKRADVAALKLKIEEQQSAVAVDTPSNDNDELNSEKVTGSVGEDMTDEDIERKAEEFLDAQVDLEDIASADNSDSEGYDGPLAEAGGEPAEVKEKEHSLHNEMNSKSNDEHAVQVVVELLEQLADEDPRDIAETIVDKLKKILSK